MELYERETHQEDVEESPPILARLLRSGGGKGGGGGGGSGGGKSGKGGTASTRRIKKVAVAVACMRNCREP